MRILGVGDSNDLLAMYLQLQEAGHEVRVVVRDAASGDVGAGLVVRVEGWEGQLGWVREAREDGLLLFETASDGALQDSLRHEGFQVVGGSRLGDALENDRRFGQSILTRAGLRVAASWSFESFHAGIAFVRTRPGRYVYKPDGGGFASTRTYVGQLDDGADMIALLESQEASWAYGPRACFVLMQHVHGVEMGVGAYFDGKRFLSPACLDWEHKRFFPGDLGEMTGEMGTLVTYRQSEAFFRATLARLEEWLLDAGYCGYINLNTIVNEEGIWPLEFTCRFGYPGYAILSSLQVDPWATLFRRMLAGGGGAFATRPGFAVGVVLTVPPFPYPDGYGRLSRGLPILLRVPPGAAGNSAFHLGEVGRNDRGLVTAGAVGYVGVATGWGADAAEARDNAYLLARQVVIPNARYRRDIAERFLASDQATLRNLGWLA